MTLQVLEEYKEESVVCKELQDIIEMEELILDGEKLTELNDMEDIDKIINEFRYEFISRYNDNDEYSVEIITAVYKFSEELKQKLHK